MSECVQAAEKGLFAALTDRSEFFRCAENQWLFKQGNTPRGLHLVCEGEVNLTLLSPTGNIVTSFSALPGSVLGLPAVMENAPYSLSAVACKDSEIGFLDNVASKN
jgi:CRP-like cAMP-binding protein